ncbi:MAG: alpha-amylase family glycosyl hydrolase [Cellulosilyticaceae bacterium]
MKLTKQISKLLVIPLAFGIIAGPVTAAPRTGANADWNVNFSGDGSNPSGYFGEWPGHQYFPSPQDWRQVSIYQFLTDRFADGNASNNEGKYGGYNLYKVDERHGGDFQGVKNNLDYIKSLGYNAIWISPIFQNRDNSYHGYGQIDFTLLDERFGTLEDFRDMVDTAHSKGMYVIVDIVVNHLSDLYSFEGYPNGGAPFRLHNGEYRLNPYNPNESYEDFPVDNNFDPNGQYCDVYGSDGTKKVDSGMGSGSFWNSDLHHNGNISDYGDAWSNHLGKIYGSLDDLRTTHPRVQDKIIAMTKSLIASTDIDGIRMDTPMQVPLYFFKRWTPAVKDYAASLGKENFLVFGEFLCDRGRSATMIGRGKEPSQVGNPNAFIDNTYTMDGGINYQMYFNFFNTAIKEQKYGSLNECKNQFEKDLKAYDLWKPKYNESRYTMFNFFNNHDQARLVHAYDGFKKTKLASSIIAFWPGVPLFYYGDEQDFCSNGDALSGESREDFMTSLAWYNVGSKFNENPAVKNNFNMCHPTYQYIQKLMNVKRQYPALQTTDELYERWCQSDGSSGIYAYSRVWGDEKNWALVAFNTWSDHLEAKDFFTGWKEGDEIVNALNPSERYRLGKDGKMSSLWISPYETKVFVRADNLQSLDPVVTNVTPEHDTRVYSDTETISITFSEDMDENSVKHAFKYDGNSVSSNALSYDAANRTLTYSANVADGIHSVEISENAKSLEGKHLYGKFKSRLRKGSDMNPLANPSAKPIFDKNLVSLSSPAKMLAQQITTDSAIKLATDIQDNATDIQDNATELTTGSAIKLNANTFNKAFGNYDTPIMLHHSATGAKYLRISSNQGATWSKWMPYAAEMQWLLPSKDMHNNILVQYWADDSAAYFVEGKLE